MTPNLNGVNAVLDRMSTVQSRFSTSGPSARTLGSAGSATSFDSALDLLRHGAEDGSATTGTDSPMRSAQMFRTLTTSGTGPSKATTPAVSGRDAVDAAKKYLGVPYVWGGTDPASGLDCSGLLQRAYADLGVELPRTSGEQAQVGTPVTTLADARPGDLVAFGQPVNHIGMYAGNGQMVVAPHRGDVVKLQDITAQPVAIRRVLPDSGTSASPPSIASLLAADSPTVAQLLEAVLRDGAASASPLPEMATGLATTAGAGSGGAAATPYAELFKAAGAKYGIDPDVLAAVARAESSMNPSAVSGAGAQGLMQLMPATAAGLGVDPMQPAQAIDGAARLLSRHLEQFGSLDLALAAYNAGAGAVTRYNGIPPYSETQGYVRKILADLGVGATGVSAAATAAGEDPAVQRFSSPTATPAAPTATPTAVVPVTTPPSATTTAPVATGTTGSGITMPDPASPISKPTPTAWGPNTQRQVTSQGGTNGTSWEALGYLKPADSVTVTGTVPKAKGPVALGVLRILQNATPAQLASKEFRQTLNDVNRDSLGDPTAPDVIEIDPAKDPAPVANPNPNTGAAAAAAPVAATPTPSTIARVLPVTAAIATVTAK